MFSSTDKLDVAPLGDGEEFAGEQEQLNQARKFKTNPAQTTSSSLLKLHEQAYRTRSYTAENPIPSSFSGLPSSSNEMKKAKCQSLPRIYKMTVNPSIDKESDPYRYICT